MKKGTFVERLSQALVDREFISSKQAANMQKVFAKAQKPQFDDFLLEEGIVSERDLLAALADVFDMPSIDIGGMLLNHDLITMFPKEVMLSNSFVPLEQDGNMLVVVANNPEQSELLEIIGEYVSYSIVFFVGLNRDICDAVEEFYDGIFDMGFEIEFEVDFEDELDPVAEFDRLHK
ncbi:hypothetical protein HOL34_00360 [bacterium]|jgi:hypothetical protein|nr:hypothetical protein [bacterium]MBT3903339.1 hypothetical protein [bacterium]MBT4578159.1 hypothetical protein [bacterium]MBT5345503.1 hypothetical protein [bacterium]MBT6131197.1 hypothetical protein [bacterium]